MGEDHEAAIRERISSLFAAVSAMDLDGVKRAHDHVSVPLDVATGAALVDLKP